MTAAYLAGSGAAPRQAIRLGVAVSLMHTLSVIAVGALVLLAHRALPPERVYPWLGLVAGITATLLGGWLFVTRLRSTDHTAAHHHAHLPLSRPTLGALAAAGGLLPSPSALVVLVASVALGRVLFGLGLIVAFSVGLAGALAAIGMLAARARDALLRRSWSRAAEALPLLAAVAIFLVGVFLLTKTAIEL